jgi:hypothetical protein
MVRNAMVADFHFVPQKVPFPFSECQNRVFREAYQKAKSKAGLNSPHK